ncbi:hypothetical protein [Tepidimonas charontis]|uniref:Uncharacterized protein n=1 Tax=Tepidimonas charontis TaxID=2267262 RepID=A0A554X3H9_9BURK|nr:hypothetical protein [Tepidimonas charontis]TSE30399.1 hypothetical protein Tchar_02452 [Tepidimonas charontis]
MRAHRIKAHVKPNQPLVVELPPDLPETEAEVIILLPDTPATKPTFATLEEYDAWLKRQPPSPYTAEEIERHIAEERAAWGE